MQNIDNDLLFDEFVDYQPIFDDDGSADAWPEAEVVDGKDDNENKKSIIVLMSCGITLQIF